jgi:hypothetical protein
MAYCTCTHSMICHLYIINQHVVPEPFTRSNALHLIKCQGVSASSSYRLSSGVGDMHSAALRERLRVRAPPPLLLAAAISGAGFSRSTSTESLR